jgi:flagellin
LQRIRELAVQSANATNSDSDRAALDQEVSQRLAEIDRIASQTSFNGRKVLDGSFGNASFQVGANVGETIDLNLATSVRQADIGAIATTATTGLAAIFGATAAAATPTDTVSSGAYTQAASDNAADAFQLTIDGTVVSDRLVGAATAANLDTDIAAFVAGDSNYSIVSGSVATGDLVLRKEDGTDLTIATSFSDGVGSTNAAAGTTSDGTFANAFVTTHTGGTPAVVNTLTLASGELSIQNGTDTAVEITGAFASADELADAINANVAGVFASVTDAGEVSLSSTEALTITGTAVPAGLADAAVSGSLSAASVTTIAGANETIQRIDSALTSVSNLRSTFGAIQNRFESTIANLSTTTESLSAARSRIQDADFAAETANLTRAQILQQAGTAILAQANALPQNVLGLLG